MEIVYSKFWPFDQIDKIIICILFWSLLENEGELSFAELSTCWRTLHWLILRFEFHIYNVATTVYQFNLYLALFNSIGWKIALFSLFL